MRNVFIPKYDVITYLVFWWLLERVSNEIWLKYASGSDF